MCKCVLSPGDNLISVNKKSIYIYIYIYIYKEVHHQLIAQFLNIHIQTPIHVLVTTHSHLHGVSILEDRYGVIIQLLNCKR